MLPLRWFSLYLTNMALRCNWFARLPVTQKVAGSNPVWVAIKRSNQPFEKKSAWVIARWETFKGYKGTKPLRVKNVWLEDNGTHSSKYKHNRAANPCVRFLIWFRQARTFFSEVEKLEGLMPQTSMKAMLYLKQIGLVCTYQSAILTENNEWKKLFVRERDPRWQWGYSSVGRAPVLHTGGRGFKSL